MTLLPPPPILTQSWALDMPMSALCGQAYATTGWWMRGCGRHSLEGKRRTMGGKLSVLVAARCEPGIVTRSHSNLPKGHLMSQCTRKPTRAGVVVAVLAASLFSLGLLAPSASASTIASQPRDGGSLLGNLCTTEDIGWGDGEESLYCDANDIASLLSGLLDPVFNLTCLNRETNVVICRV